jgi:hypothetical protein
VPAGTNGLDAFVQSAASQSLSIRFTPGAHPASSSADIQFARSPNAPPPSNRGGNPPPSKRGGNPPPPSLPPIPPPPDPPRRPRVPAARPAVGRNDARPVVARRAPVGAEQHSAGVAAGQHVVVVDIARAIRVVVGRPSLVGKIVVNGGVGAARPLLNEVAFVQGNDPAQPIVPRPFANSIDRVDRIAVRAARHAQEGPPRLDVAGHRSERNLPADLVCAGETIRSPEAQIATKAVGTAGKLAERREARDEKAESFTRRVACRTIRRRVGGGNVRIRRNFVPPAASSWWSPDEGQSR